MTCFCDDYDTPWKEAIERYLPDFMAFYFPQAHARIDWLRPYRFLNQELAQVVQDAELGRRLADRLVEVGLLDGDAAWVYIHIEVQGQLEPHFAERLFVYNYRIYDRYRRPVATLAVLTDDHPGWQPDRFGYELFGSRHYLEFPTVKLLDYQGQVEALLTQPNPFALVSAAYLLTRQTKGDDQQRYAVKWRLTRLLYERNWDKQRIIDLYAVIDWLMNLPEELNRQLWRDLATLERNKSMPYVTSVERFGIEKGLLQGMQQGLQQGLLQGEATVLIRQLTKRFGPLPPAMQDRLNQATTDQLESWAERVLDADTLEAVFNHH
ncbi:MAG: DUF4351 domain-containing protein [Methylococcaceae bacterium]|nr:MAG: DUF4351 domain-containing protein [Methylococcaceae bacterium]